MLPRAKSPTSSIIRLLFITLCAYINVKHWRYGNIPRNSITVISITIIIDVPAKGELIQTFGVCHKFTYLFPTGNPEGTSYYVRLAIHTTRYSNVYLERMSIFRACPDGRNSVRMLSNTVKPNEMNISVGICKKKKKMKNMISFLLNTYDVRFQQCC